MEQGTVLAGRYRLDRRLGGGGMGEVWEGNDQVLRRRVAVKLVRADLRDHPQVAEQVMARFRREGEAAARLNHRNIATVHDFGEHRRAGDDQIVPFLVLEFLAGGDLGSLLADARGQGLPIGQVLEYAVQACEGLAAVHAAGVVHRDIKPANLMLVADGTLKICDFGIARIDDATCGLTRVGAALGTPAYMAPEQRQGLTVDHRADLYALGATLYRLLTGSARTSDPPGAHRTGVPPALDALISALLADSPEHRPESAAAVVDRLHAISRHADRPHMQVPALNTGWKPEWHLLWASEPHAPTRGESNSVQAMAFAPHPVDGRLLLATGSHDNTVQLWDAATGEPAGQAADTKLGRLWEATTRRSTGRTRTGHTKPVRAVAFAPKPVDGELLLATGSDDKTVRLWNAVTRKPVGEPLTGHTRPVRAAAFAPQPVPGPGLLLATGSDDKAVRLWNAATRKPVGRPLTGHTEAVNSVAFAPHPIDGRTLLATGSLDKTIRLWDAATRKPVGEPLTGHTRPVRAVAFAPRPVNGRLLLASGSADGTVRLWDATTGEPVGHPLTGHTRPVRAVAFAPQPVEGRLLLATGSDDKTVRLWDAATGAPLGQTHHTRPVKSLAFAPQAPNGRLLLATGFSDGSVRMWDG
ncbi:WD40 repeat domain-containing serine/threonine protein kinase [Actinomadura sp. 3N508]|uniref:WD40 repeat domain-containing serine/threonine protein kinase n=1 Tax=Actinomadura sp. 3N508 TaxID=3375153 RepID=UPI00379255E5